ncbi:hypothetical protein JTE90_010302 [Oedothorax gibbosus]|uniref:Monocarboxylate transporter n=1 Tax=Oedothorax gibbosus TaxID=931172 RepID=A0AAV6V4A0_9ARAC|nr:hypothetical protein JTE90_010302 [Oedothorax gibbosus]
MTKDVGFSWVIALACCFLNCLLYGVTRLSGLLMVSTVETFQVTRATAAIPFSVSTSVRNLSGIYVGYLGQKLGLRAVISSGCILASVGAGFCFFASDVFWITICWGGLFGIGCGFATCLLPLAINNNFENHRGTALGLSYSGSYIGSFIFPPIVVQLIKLYGLPGAFLVISATLLNGLAASLLFGTTSSKTIKNKKVLNLENSIKQVRDEASSQKVHGVSERCFKGLWHKLIHHIKICLFYSKELADDTRVDIPVHLTSDVYLKDQNNISIHQPVSNNSVHFKRSVRNKSDSTLLNSTYMKTRNSKFKNHSVEFYLHSKNSISKSNSHSDNKNNVTKLKRIILARHFMKHYNLRNSQISSQPVVQLVSIKTAEDSFYTNTIKKCLFENNCLKIDQSNKEVCEVTIKEQSSYYKQNQAIKRFCVIKNLSPNIKLKTKFDYVVPRERAVPKCLEIERFNYKTKVHSQERVLTNQTNLRTGIFMPNANLNNSENCDETQTNRKTYKITKTFNKNALTSKPQIENNFDKNKNEPKESSNKDLVLNTTIDVQKSTNLYPKLTENETSIEGTCSQRILRLKQAKVSFSPKGKSPETKNPKDSTSSKDNPSPCASNNTFSKENAKHLSSSKSISESLHESGFVRDTAKCCFSWFQMYSHPMFMVITTTMSLHTFVVVCMITIIEDFAKDMHVPENKVYTVLMALSIADLLGSLTLGVVTDRKFMSGCSFVAVCFLGASACIVAISRCRTLSSLLVLISCYGMFETGVIITLPLLITQFVEEKRQAIALAASNILSSPTVLLVPLVIGYFRDRGGCYSGVFYILALTSFTSSIVWMVAPYLINKFRNTKEPKCNC